MQDALTLERRHLIVRQARTLGGSRPDLRRPAPVPPVHLGGPAAHGPAHQRVTPARHRRGQRARGPIGELGREYHWREEPGGGRSRRPGGALARAAGAGAARSCASSGGSSRRRGRGPAAPSAPSSRGRAGRGSRAGASGARARCPSSRAPSAPSRCSARSGTARGRAVPTLLALGQVVDAAARKPSWRHDSRAQRAVGRASAIGGQGTANSSRVSLQYARVRPSGVLQSESLSMSVRNCACSDPTTLPSRSYKTIGAVPTTPIVPSTYAMGGNPIAVAWSGIPTKQDVPGSATPRKVSTPVHPSPPPSSPVAVNSIGSVDGKSVTPGLNVITPVGASGVPPHVHTRVPRSGAARLAVACTSASATTAIAMLWSPARMISSL